MDERERERVIVEPAEPRVERETTVIATGDRGGGGIIAAVVLLLVVAVALFFFFGGYFEKAADGVDVNVNVDTPKVEVPDIDVNLPPPSQPANQSGN